MLTVPQCMMLTAAPCCVHQVEVVVALDGGPLLPGEAEVALGVAAQATAILVVAAAVQQHRRGTDSRSRGAGCMPLHGSACPCNTTPRWKCEGNKRLRLSRFVGSHREPGCVCSLMGEGAL